jgi:predicted N-formylglutamate amidohydrolase
VLRARWQKSSAFEHHEAFSAPNCLNGQVPANWASGKREWIVLTADEIAPVNVYNERSSSPFLIVADHAGNYIPRRLGRLGLPETEIERHIGWDIGIAGVCQVMADALDATLIMQNYSRLVIDCNRPLDSDELIPEISELTPIPGNIGLSVSARDTRVREIFRPYHDRIDIQLSGGQARSPRALIAMHSFTPDFKGKTRSWHVGVLFNRDARLARQLMAFFKWEKNFIVGENEPYDVSDDSDYTIPIHGERRGIHHVGIEIRQDLILGVEGQQQWGLRLAGLLSRAYRQATSTDTSADKV